MDRIGSIKLFVRLAELGSFTAVAQSEGIRQPLVSKSLKALEDYLGVQLVNRTSRQLVISDSGKAFYIQAHRLDLKS